MVFEGFPCLWQRNKIEGFELPLHKNCIYTSKNILCTVIEPRYIYAH